MLKIFIIVVFLVFSLDANSLLQEFLNRADKHYSLEKIEAKKEIFTENKFNKTMIEKLRVSAEYSRFDKDDIDAEYDLRIYPKTFLQRDKEISAYELVKKRLDISYEDAILKVLRKQYSLLFDAYFMKKSYQNYQDILQLEKKQLVVAVKSTGDVSDVINLVKIKNSIKKTEFKLKEINQSFNTKLFEMQYYLQDAELLEIKTSLETKFVFDIDLIVNFIKDKENFFLETFEKSMKKEQIELLLAKNEMELNKADEGLKIHSIDIAYENRKDFDKSISLGISLEKTWPGSNQLGKIDDKIDFLKAQNALASLENELKLEVSTLIKDIQRLNSNLLYINENIQNENFLKIYKSLKNPDPLKLLILQKSHLMAKKEIIKIEKQIYNKFVKLLYITHNLTYDFLFKSEL